MWRWSALRCWRRGLSNMTFIAGRRPNLVHIWWKRCWPRSNVAICWRSKLRCWWTLQLQWSKPLCGWTWRWPMICNAGRRQNALHAICMWNTTASAVLVLAEDKLCHVEAAAQQRREEDKSITALVMLPDPIDTVIRNIWEEWALCAAPLDAILDKIACNNITHDAPALRKTTLPPPMAMLSTSLTLRLMWARS
jgi:hypothetical protein